MACDLFMALTRAGEVVEDLRENRQCAGEVLLRVEMLCSGSTLDGVHVAEAETAKEMAARRIDSRSRNSVADQ